MYINKTIILCNKQNKAVGLCKLERYRDQTTYEIRLNDGKPPFNIALQTPDAHLFIKMDESTIVGNWENTLTLPIMIVGGDEEITFQGSTNGRDFYDVELVEYFYSNIKITESAKEVKTEQVETDIKTDYNQEESKDNAEEVSNDINEKIAFVGVEPEQVEEEPEKSKECEFFDKIQGELSKIFSTYPPENALSEQIEQSQWAKVPVDENAYYVVGLISQDGTPKYICYGVPDIDNSNPPKEKCESQWIPIENSVDNIGGYWVMFQSAKDGKA